MTEAARARVPDPDRLVRVGDLVGLPEIARRAGVTRSAVSNWRNRHDDFPLPVFSISEGARVSPVFVWPEVAAWLDDHPPAIDPDAPLCTCGRRLLGPYYDATTGLYGWRHYACPYCPPGSACRSTAPSAAGAVLERFEALHDHPIHPPTPEEGP